MTDDTRNSHLRRKYMRGLFVVHIFMVGYIWMLIAITDDEYVAYLKVPYNVLYDVYLKALCIASYMILFREAA